MSKRITLPLSQFRRRMNSIFKKFESDKLERVDITVKGVKTFVSVSPSYYDDLQSSGAIKGA